MDVDHALEDAIIQETPQKRPAPDEPEDAPPSNRKHLDDPPSLKSGADIFDGDEVKHSKMDQQVIQEALTFDSFLFQDQPLSQPALAILLNFIATCSDGKLDSKYVKLTEARKLLETNNSLRILMQSAWSSQTFKDIRNLVDLRALQNTKVEIPEPPLVETQEGQSATMLSWEKKFVGGVPKFLRGILQGYMTQDAQNELYCPAVTHVQSSGTGKSRAHDELAKTIFYIPLNLARYSNVSYPPPDPRVVEWFKPLPASKQQLARDRCHAFLHALLSITLRRISDIEKAVAKKIKSKPQSRLSILASEFRKKMTEGREFENHGEYRTKFYEEVCAHAEQNLNVIDPLTELDPSLVAKAIKKILGPKEDLTVVICWDESHLLHESEQSQSWTMFSELQRALRTLKDSSIISVFVSTTWKFYDVSHNPDLNPSFRLMKRVLHMPPPITQIGFDLFAVKVDCIKEEWSLSRIASTHQIVHFGRVLFPTRYDNGDDKIRASIIDYAADKLLSRTTNIHSLEKHGLQPNQSLACLAVRLGLDFKATSWVDGATERRQVERHLRICLDPEGSPHGMVTISPSEPLLAEASFKVMSMQLSLRDAPKVLLEHIDGSYLNPGDRGEVVAALLLLLARDRVIKNRTECKENQISVKDAESDGLRRIVTVPEFIDALVPLGSRSKARNQKPICWSPGQEKNRTFESAFAKAHIYFNHFIKVHDLKIINRKYLWRLICRGAAVICASNQRAVDIVIPVLIGTIMHPTLVTAIFVQVKNDSAYNHRVVKSLFTNMDPFTVGLFSEADRNRIVPPILRIVLALASEESAAAVTEPKHPTRCSSRNEQKKSFTAYDLWIAGVSSQSFGVIPDYNTQNIYKDLLNRAQNSYNKCKKTKDTPSEEEQYDVELRRMVLAGASSEDQHFQNYISNLGEVPDYEYNVAEYVEDKGPLVSDQKDANVGDNVTDDEDASMGDDATDNEAKIQMTDV